MNAKKDKGYMVIHTHWDREWRYPIWENRMYLVNFMEELLNILDTDSDYKSFLLDGQSVVIEDYLEVRPEDKERVKKYIIDGKISIGPWYTLPDLYPLDGEFLIRNLMRGIRFSQSLGGYLNVAYESFGWGQTAQFPQIYKGFGIDVAIVAKNVSKERAPESEFIWESPDGTQILATRLGQYGRANFFFNSYLKIMNGMDYMSDDYRMKWEKGCLLYHQADERNYHQDYLQLGIAETIHDELIKDAVQAAWDATDETTVKSHRIIMNGCDSTTPQPMITEIVKKANSLFDDKEFVLSTLEEYTDKLKETVKYEGLKVVKGELRDGPSSSCSANALMTRPYIKILNKKAQNTLLRCAEPLSVICSMLGAKYDKTFLDIAMKYMLLSHPHDSINGVTQDKTADDVINMLSQALEIGSVITNTSCGEIIKQINTGSFDCKDILIVVFNPSPFARNDVIKIYLDTPMEYNTWDFDIIDCDGNKVDTQFVSRKEEVTPVNNLQARPWPFYIDRHCRYMETGEVPAGGYKVYKAKPIKHFNRKSAFWAEMRTSNGSNISKSTRTMENEHLKVTVENNGTLSIYDKTSQKLYTNLNYFEDTGDCGDYWIYYPPHNNKTYTGECCQARIWAEDNGSLSATISAEIKMTLPAYSLRPENEIRGESRRSGEEKELTAVVSYTLNRGAKKVDVKLRVDNTVEDHRFRVMFDTGIKAEYSCAAGHFTVDKRPVNPQKDCNGKFWSEMQTLPQQSFVDINDGTYGMALVNNCMTEFEAIGNEEGTLALTLLRGVRNIICTEHRVAGAFPHQKGGQSLGVLEYEYAIYPHMGDWREAGVYTQAESLNVPLKPIQASRNDKGILPLKQSFFSVEPHDLILSAFKKSEDGDSLILRLFNPTSSLVEGCVKIYAEIKEAFYTDLNEQRLNSIRINDPHSISIEAKSREIVTIELVL